MCNKNLNFLWLPNKKILNEETKKVFFKKSRKHLLNLGN